MEKAHVIIGLFFALVCSGFSQDTAYPVQDTVSLDEIIVTAFKIPLARRESAKPVQAIRRADIESRPVRDVAQLLEEVVGITVNGANSNPGLNKGIYLRGAGAAYTLVLIDGQPVSDPSGLGGPLDLRLLPVDLIERIEVLKGSQSTLYGTDAIAGVIHIITRKGGEKPLSFNGNLAYGSFNTFDAGAGVSGRTGMLDYQLQYQRAQTDGISEAADPTGSGHFDDDGFLQQSLQANTSLQIGSNLRIRPSFRWSQFDGDTDADAFTDGANRYEARFINSGIDAQLQLRSLNATANYTYSETDRTFRSSFGEFPFRGRLHNAEILLGYRFNENVHLLGGFHFQRHGMLEKSSGIPDPSIDIASPFLTLLLRDVKGFNLELGYRLSHHSTFDSESVFSIAPAYQVNEHLRLLASFTTGFKVPTLYELYGAFGGNPDLEPQLSDSWEAGLQSNWLDGKLQAGFSLFQRTIKDIIVYAFTPGYFNQDKQEDYGVEVEWRWKAFPGFSIDGHYAFVDGQITTRNAQERDTSFFNLVRRPRHRLSLAFDYQPFSRLSFRLQGQYLDRRIDYFFNPQNFYAVEEVDLDAVFLVHFSVRYKILEDRLSFFADLRNLTAASFTEVYGYSTPGRNGHVGVRWEW